MRMGRGDSTLRRRQRTTAELSHYKLEAGGLAYRSVRHNKADSRCDLPSA
jgi:hypothetical protein